jgi:hypothetical protein
MIIDYEIRNIANVVISCLFFYILIENLDSYKWLHSADVILLVSNAGYVFYKTHIPVFSIKPASITGMVFSYFFFCSK